MKGVRFRYSPFLPVVGGIIWKIIGAVLSGDSYQERCSLLQCVSFCYNLTFSLEVCSVLCQSALNAVSLTHKL
jgi:hypothetical protein